MPFGGIDVTSLEGALLGNVEADAQSFDSSGPFGGINSVSGKGQTLKETIKEVVIEGGKSFKDNRPMQYFNKQLIWNFNPDITGFSLCFMVPPPLLGLDLAGKYNSKYVEGFRKLIVFAAFDFTPPTRQISTEKLTNRSGGLPYATQVEPSEQCTVSYIDNADLDIFNFHCVWFEYIKDLTLGYTGVPSTYLEPGSPNYGGLDYAGSLYVVRYDVSMQDILYVGKVTGIYPQTLPNKEMIGQRSTNEITVVPFTYFAGWYDETLDTAHPIWAELEDFIIPFYG